MIYDLVSTTEGPAQSLALTIYFLLAVMVIAMLVTGAQWTYKYEHRIDSVSAGRLHDIARELNAPLESFFEGLDQNEAQLRSPRQRMLLDIVRNF
jgi:hypothetical protein